MKKIKLIYASVHHKNTKKVVDYLSKNFCGRIDVTDILEDKNHSIENYEYIIFASGIYFGKVHKSIREYIDNKDVAGKKVILLYTYGIRYKNYAAPIKKVLRRKNAKYLGSIYCRGYDTYGFLNRIGGIAKNHPNEKDFNKILSQLEKILE